MDSIVTPNSPVPGPRRREKRPVLRRWNVVVPHCSPPPCTWGGRSGIQLVIVPVLGGLVVGPAWKCSATSVPWPVPYMDCAGTRIPRQCRAAQSAQRPGPPVGRHHLCRLHLKLSRSARRIDDLFSSACPAQNLVPGLEIHLQQSAAADFRHNRCPGLWVPSTVPVKSGVYKTQFPVRGLAETGRVSYSAGFSILLCDHARILRCRQSGRPLPQSISFSSSSSQSSSFLLTKAVLPRPLIPCSNMLLLFHCFFQLEAWSIGQNNSSTFL